MQPTLTYTSVKLHNVVLSGTTEFDFVQIKITQDCETIAILSVEMLYDFLKKVFKNNPPKEIQQNYVDHGYRYYEVISLEKI